MLNPDLDATALATQYEQDQRLRIGNLLLPSAARNLLDSVSAVPFEYTFHVNGQNHRASKPEMLALSAEQRQKLQSDMHAAAAEGIGFFYASYRLTASRRAAAEDALLRVHELLDFLNSDEMLAFVSRVSGRDDLRSADGQVTAYTPGHYLTRHRDRIDGEERRLAYVLGLTEEWHPDWGGLLQFYDDDGTPRDAWAPRYNSLALFDVRHVHAVTYVTPYARKPRLSLTGWFHSKE